MPGDRITLTRSEQRRLVVARPSPGH